MTSAGSASSADAGAMMQPTRRAAVAPAIKVRRIMTVLRSGVRSRSRCLRLHGNRGSHNPTRIRTETEYIFPLRNGLKSRFLPFVNTP